MIKVIFKIIFYFLFFIFTIFLFLPKDNLYFLLEKKISKYNVILSNETVDFRMFNFYIKDADIYYDGLKFAKMKQLKLGMYLYKNTFQIRDFILYDAFKNLLPTKIKKLTINYNLLTYQKAFIKSSGNFGTIDGEIDLKKRSIIMNLKASNLMKEEYKTILNYMNFEKGVYKYEYKFK